MIIEPAQDKDPIPALISSRRFDPVVRQVAGDSGWALRIRYHNGIPVFHLLNSAMQAIPHPTIRDNGGVPILSDIGSAIADGNLSYRLRLDIPDNIRFEVMSPETGARRLPVTITREPKGYLLMRVDMSGLKVYGVISGKQVD